MSQVAAMRQLDGFTIAEFAFAQRAALPRHSHPAPHFTIVAGGMMTDFADGRMRRLSAAQGLAYPAATVHENLVACRATAIAIQLDRHDETAQALDALTAPLLVDAATLAPLLPQLRQGLRGTSRASALLLRGLVLQLVAGALEPRGRDDDVVIAAAESFINANLAARIEVRDVARAAGYSPTHFARLFRARMGTSVGAYVRDARARAAAQALAGGDEPLSEVALRCGYGDQAHFTNAFRAAYGETPGRFRRAARRRS
jgi:AraC family transcriptional regulator